MNSQPTNSKDRNARELRDAEPLEDPLANAVVKLARGSLRNAKPQRGVCEECGGVVEPVEMFGRWHLPSICGELWHGPGLGDPVGCLGRQDHADHLERVEELRRKSIRQAFQNAGLDTKQVKKAAQHGPLMVALQGFEKPLPKHKDRAREHQRERDELDDILGLGSPSRGEERHEYLREVVAEVFDPFGAFLHGGFGTGKTTQLILSCVHYLRLGWSVRYATQEEVIASLRKGSEEPRSVEYWNSFDLLAIDELGYGLTTDWQRAQVFAVVDARYRARKALLVASNFTPTDMMAPPSAQGGLFGGSAKMTPYLGQRTVDRLMEMTGAFPIGGGSHLVLELAEVFRRDG